MDDRNNYNDPWDSGEYKTGRTRPPKRHGGCIAALLVLVILLFGVISLLSFLNVRLFVQLAEGPADSDDIAFHVSSADNTDPSSEATEESRPTEIPTVTATAPEVELQTSPQSVENVPEEGGLSLQEIYNKNIPSVVSISCTLSGSSSTGTGVIFSEDGYIVTNCHVVDGAKAINVLLTDQREFPASLIGADSVSDLAVLHIDADNLTASDFGDSTVLRVGDSVAAIGDPLGMEFRGTMTDGIVSAINRDVTTGGRTLTLIQTNAALNSGNSGGPLINCYGQVIGINTLKIGTFTDSAGVEGIGFAIPSATVKEIVEQLITQGYVSGRPSLGIAGSAVSTFDQYYFHLPAGFYIEEVEAGSPAEDVGIEPGDILISVDGTRIYSADDLETVLYPYQAGDTVTIIIQRGNRQYQADLPLTEAKG